MLMYWGKAKGWTVQGSKAGRGEILQPPYNGYRLSLLRVKRRGAWSSLPTSSSGDFKDRLYINYQLDALIIIYS